MIPEHTVGGQRFGGEHVEDGHLGHLAFQRDQQCVLIHHVAPSHIDEHRPRFHRGADHVASLVAACGGQHHDVGLGRRVRQTIGRDHCVDGLVALRRAPHSGDMRAECSGPGRNFTAD